MNLSLYLTEPRKIKKFELIIKFKIVIIQQHVLMIITITRSPNKKPTLSSMNIIFVIHRVTFICIYNLYIIIFSFYYIFYKKKTKILLISLIINAYNIRSIVYWKIITLYIVCAQHNTLNDVWNTRVLNRKTTAVNVFLYRQDILSAHMVSEIKYNFVNFPALSVIVVTSQPWCVRQHSSIIK